MAVKFGQVLFFMLMLIAAFKGYKLGLALKHEREVTEAQLKHTMDLNDAYLSDHDLLGTLQSYTLYKSQVPRYCVTIHNTWLPQVLQAPSGWSLKRWLYGAPQDTTTYCVDKSGAWDCLGMLFCLGLVVVYWPYKVAGSENKQNQKGSLIRRE